MLVTIIVAAPGQGKTELFMKLAGEKCLCFVPTPAQANPKFAAWPWAEALEFAQGLPESRRQLAESYGKLRLVLKMDKAEEVLPWFVAAGEIWKGWTFGFDDFPQLFTDVPSARQFAAFSAGIRHRGCNIIVTTQRIHGLIPRFVRSCSDIVYQVGPVYAREDGKDLYELSSGKDTNFDQFYSRISTTPKYGVFPVRELDIEVHNDG